MHDISRRSLLTGTGAAAAAVALDPLAGISIARASSPAACKQAPGFYRYKVGDIEVTVVTDGVNRFKLPDDMVGNVPKSEVEAALAAAHVEAGMFYNPYNPVVVNTGAKLVLLAAFRGDRRRAAAAVPSPP